MNSEQLPEIVQWATMLLTLLLVLRVYKLLDNFAEAIAFLLLKQRDRDVQEAKDAQKGETCQQ
jgi:hypothetical protein